MLFFVVLLYNGFCVLTKLEHKQQAGSHRALKVSEVSYNLKSPWKERTSLKILKYICVLMMCALCSGVVSKCSYFSLL